jgi:hypothetical protein
MAAPSYATNLTDITLAESTTSWSALGGGASGLSASPDIAVEGTNCVDKQVTNAEKGQMYDYGSTITMGSADHVYIWISITTPGLVDTYANRGLAATIGTGTGARNTFHLTGSDRFKLAEAFACWPVRYVTTSSGTEPLRTLTGSPGANPQFFGATTNITASVKGANLGVDAMRYGNSVTVTAGDSGTPATWIDFADYSNNSTRRWGIISPFGSGIGVQGLIVWGDGTTAVYARDSNTSVALLDVPHCLSTLNAIEFNNASTDVIFDNISVTALGTQSRGTITVNNNATVEWTNSVFQDIDTTTLDTNSTFDGCTWISTNEVDSGGASLLGASFLTPTVAADSYALLWNETTDPDGELDGATFSKGSNDHHAIQFGDTIPTTITVRNCTFTNFSASNSANGSTFYFKDTSGTITINCVNCTGNLTYKSDGATINVVTNTVTTTIKAVDATGANVSSVRALLKASAGTGDLPYNDSVSITQTSGTATVSHTTHGMSTNDYVIIEGAIPEGYNKIAQITVTGANAYTYSVDSGLTSPATGTPIATGVLVYGVTDANGEVSDTRSMSAAQPVTGWARKSTSSPLYKTAPLNGTASNTADTTITGVMLSDED